MIHLLALAGVLSISFSAVFVRLASVSPDTTTLFRALYALPLLGGLWLLRRRDDRRTASARWLALASGLVLTLDLNFWHESIALIGAGLGTVIANVQVVFVALASWVLYRERPHTRTTLMIAVILVGVALTSGLARHDAYGSAPVAGAALGVLAGACYAVFLLMFRAASLGESSPVGVQLDSTIGMAAGALACAPLDPHFAFTPVWPAHGWLLLLAVVSQVVGWLLIATAMPRLRPIETSIFLLGQPVVTIFWGVLFFGERLSALQWIGTAVVLLGVGVEAVASASAASLRAE